jgi:hypothetical protein
VGCSEARRGRRRIGHQRSSWQCRGRWFCFWLVGVGSGNLGRLTSGNCRWVSESIALVDFGVLSSGCWPGFSGVGQHLWPKPLAGWEERAKGRHRRSLSSVGYLSTSGGAIFV